MKTLISKIQKKNWNIIWEFISKNARIEILDKLKNQQVIQNLNYSNAHQKRVLICYKSYGFLTNFNIKNDRTTPFEIFKIVSVFSQLGFIVDIIYCNDIKSVEIIKNNNYFIIFGFGEVFYQMANLKPDATTIIYMTEQPPEFSLREEKKRIKYYYERHKKHAKIRRSGLFYKFHHFERLYSAVVTLGDIAPFFNNYEKVYNIFPTGIINTNFVLNNEKHNSSRNQFLWIGSIGSIHKGLDILIDIFSQRSDIILHICGLDNVERKFLNFEKKENIKDYGFVDVRSDLFLSIVNSCSYCILPSCSEGFATSITTGMLHGLIPIVTKDIGLNCLGDKAIFLEDYTVEYIDSVLSKVLEKPLNELQSMSYNAYSFARENFVLDTFETNFRTIINNILNFKAIK